MLEGTEESVMVFTHPRLPLYTRHESVEIVHDLCRLKQSRLRVPTLEPSSSAGGRTYPMTTCCMEISESAENG